METEGQLKKQIGLSVAMSIVIGTVIGSGIFMKPGVVIQYAGGSTLALVAWLLGGIITIAGGLTIAEVGVQIPKTGGLYVYMEEVYGKIWGYLCGWMQTIIYGPAIIGALGLYFGLLLANLFYLSEAWYLPLGISAVIFLATVNSLGTRYGGSIQTITTLAKFVPIVLIAVLGVWKGNEQVFSSGSPVMDQLGMGAAILATLFAYDGWMLLGFVAGEMKNPAKHLPIAIVGGLTVVTIAYLVINFAMLKVLPASEIVSQGTASAGKVAEILMGGIGAKIISVGILISIFGCMNGKILTFPRVPFAMAERHQLPFSRILSKVHPKSRTPVAAIVMQVILAVIMMVLSNPDYLSEMAIFAIYLFYIMAFIAVFILRKRRADLKRQYSVPLYPFVPLVAIAGSLFVVISTLLNQPADSLWAIGLTLIGLPVYYILQKIYQKG
ncbi:serine/threonine exchange transporter, LAT family [Paenibacillus uliginis N3/975]|uniref:Serine/threonine exchange transporter, LAT family n=1 Tax=Paenibacillus uliginis N3/975 TaxID=1313296 RepID=A0A1X7GNP5_9BACL|nr:amino acid permease [Paenibacillus uliginis]SMF72291.1 serine/threonine exchange transporter, LAT family [Paenibacillus uliginis N3/975]